MSRFGGPIVTNGVEYQHGVLALAQLAAPADRLVVGLKIALYLDSRHGTHMDQRFKRFWA